MIIIFGALKIELENILSGIKISRTGKAGGAIFYEGFFYTDPSKKEDVLIVETGMGRVNARQAARFVSKRILGSSVSKKIIITGFCGAVDPDLRVGDPVYYNEIIKLGSRDRYLKNTENISLKKYSIKLRKESGNKGHFKTAVCGCVEEAVTDPAVKTKIHKDFQADVIDMESYWIVSELLARGSFIKDIYCIRVVSDNAKDFLPIYFASKSISRTIIYFLKSVFLSIFSRKEFRANINALRNIKNAKERIDIMLFKDLL